MKARRDGPDSAVRVAVPVPFMAHHALVDLRSRSRLGRIDRGVNAKRIRACLASLQKRVTQARRPLEPARANKI